MHRRLMVVLPLLIIFSLKLAAQEERSIAKAISGKIVDDSLGFALPQVHLWNESTRMGSISNDSGEFTLKVRSQDTIVFSAIGYVSYVMVVSSSMNHDLEVRLKPKKYEIGEVIIRRFSSYESFIYQVVHLDLPEAETPPMGEYLGLTVTAAALEADRERAIKEKLERFGYTTPLGKGVDPVKIFNEKMSKKKEREQVIQAKFNRELVRDITHLEGEELTEFIAQCNFSEEYLYETDLYAIIEALYVKLKDFQHLTDSIPN